MIQSRINQTIISGLFLLIGFYFSQLMPVPGDQEFVYRTIQVRNGDTLWNLAAEYTDNSQDIRKIIYEIKKINNISDAGSLSTGVEIKIPILKRIENNTNLLVLTNKSD